MLCEPAAFQAQVMLSPAAIVSTAGFWVPLWALRKKMLPTKTSPTGWPPPPGEGTPPHPASSVAASINGDRKSTRLNSSHLVISHAVLFLKKKKYARPLYGHRA